VEALRVGVAEDEEIFRRGLIAILEEADCESVVFATAEKASSEAASAGGSIDVAIVSSEALGSVGLACPIVVLTRLDATRTEPRRADSRVKAMLPREGMSGRQLVASVRAAAGLQVEPPSRVATNGSMLDTRRVRVLQLLAGGATRMIAKNLGTSERTVKTLVRDIQMRLGATNRAQAVAEGMRLGLI
jgi:DNA-binding NarL/FixJ family response regulator